MPQCKIDEESATLELPKSVHANEQDPVLWQRLCESVSVHWFTRSRRHSVTMGSQMRKQRVFLLQYEDAWPIQVAFDIKVNQYRRRTQLSSVRIIREAQVKEKHLTPSPNQLALSRNATPYNRGYSPYFAPRPNGEPCVLPLRAIRDRIAPSSHSGLSDQAPTPSSSLTVVASSQGSQSTFRSSQSTVVSFPVFPL